MNEFKFIKQKVEILHVTKKHHLFILLVKLNIIYKIQGKVLSLHLKIAFSL